VSPGISEAAAPSVALHDSQPAIGRRAEGGNVSYQGFTHCVPSWLLPLWRRIFCRRDWHAWDEVLSDDRHYLGCDACGRHVDIQVAALRADDATDGGQKAKES